MSLADFMKDEKGKKFETKPEVKQEIKAEVPVPEESVKEETKPLVILSHMDAYIADRLKEQPKTLEQVEARDIDPESSIHQLMLPDKLKKHFDKHGFVARWINKDKRMIDRALDIRGWTLVNRVYFPNLPKHLFTANGTVERGDSVLAFMPAKRAEMLRAEPGKRSQERLKSLPIEKWKEGGESYYRPTLTEEADGEEIKERRAVQVD